MNPDNQPTPIQPADGGENKWPAPIKHKDCNPQYPIPFVCQQHEWPYGAQDEGGPYCIWCEVLRNEQGAKANQSLQAQLDAARAERDELNRKWFAATCDNGRVDKTPEAVEAFLDRIGTEEERERDELRQKLAEAEKKLEEIGQINFRNHLDNVALRTHVETLKGALRPIAEAFDPKLAGWYFNMDRLRSAKSAMEAL